jgi:hypothetical protein
MTAAEARKFLGATQIEFVLAQFVDIHGSPKAKCVPVAHFEELLTTGVGFAGFAIWGLGMGPHGPEYTAIGDLSTLTLVPGCRAMRGSPATAMYWASPTNTARASRFGRNSGSSKRSGGSIYTGIEPEFMLLERRADGTLVPFDATDTLDKPCYDYKGLARGSDFLRRLVKALQEAGLDVYQIDHEDANGQFEVNFVYRDCLTSADNYTLFKMAASEIARSLGMVCTFMPKPFSNRTGTGPFPYLCRRREAQEPVSTTRTSGGWACRSRLPFSRRHSRACARPHRACRAIDQFVQAPGCRPSAFGSDLGAGIHYLRRQQPDGDGEDSLRAARAAVAGWFVQSVPHDGGNHRRRPRRCEAQARPGQAEQYESL